MKKLLTILVLIMLIISFFQITSMYALYKEQLQGEYSTLLGAWEIAINSKDVTSSGQVETFTIANDQLGYVSSEHIQAGTIAPGGQAYFDIVIDPTNTDVSIIYKIDMSTLGKAILNAGTADEQNIELTDAIKLLKVENYFAKVDENGQLTNQTTTEIAETSENSYTNIIPISKINEGYKNYVRLYFKWLNVTQTVTEGEGANAVQKEIEINNEKDTQLSTTDTEFAIPLQINLKQYTGEVISNGS